MESGAVPSGIGRYQGALVEQNKERVQRAVDEITLASGEVSFRAVSEKSGLSRSTLYRNQALRSIVEHARNRQPRPLSLEELQRRLSRVEREVTRLRARAHIGGGTCPDPRVVYSGIDLRSASSEDFSKKPKMTHMGQ